MGLGEDSVLIEIAVHAKSSYLWRHNGVDG